VLQAASDGISERILICAPFGRDGEMIERELRRSGLSPFRCSSFEDLCGCARVGGGAVLVCDYAFSNGDVSLLAKTLASQPRWSQLPVLVLTSGGSSTGETRTLLRALQPVGDVTLMERPLHPDMLVSSVQAAIRARRHQYQIRDAIRRLKKSESTLQIYLDNTGDGIYVAHQQTGRILDINQRAVERLGYSRDELLRMSLPDIFIEGGPVAAALRDFSRSKAPGVVKMEGTKRRKDGSMFPVEMRLTSLAPALPDQILCVMHDITDRKKAESEREQEARRKDEFLALLGHELRNPLAAISTAITALSGHCTPAQSHELRQATARQVVLMRRLVDDLLDLSRITRGQLQLKKEGIDLAGLLRKAGETVQATVTERRQKLHLRLPARSVWFKADEARMEQIATNLLDNASKYSGVGGRIEFSGARVGSEIVLRCKDNGQGILPEHLDEIFEPFTREARAFDSYGEASLGIGLALVKQLVELHGGKISVESRGAGMGSLFTVRLPLVRSKPRKPAAAGPKPALSSRGPRSVILVEDNPTVASPMKVALDQAGHHVHVFPDGPTALCGVAGLRPDVVILDIGLPGMDGYELAMKLKRKKNVKGAEFVAVSGFKRRSQANKTSRVFDHYFVKPVEIRTLLTLLAARSTNGSENKARAKNQKPKKPKLPGRPRVLLVEDHPFAADAMASLLRLEGLEVRTAYTGREALEAAPDFRPQLILCDMRLGDMNGLEVIRELRSKASTRRSHAVLLTGLTESEIRSIRRKAKEEFGVNDVISKPIETGMIRKLKARMKAN
jgi:PAS domain S-box-containing protein